MFFLDLMLLAKLFFPFYFIETKVRKNKELHHLIPPDITANQLCVWKLMLNVVSVLSIFIIGELQLINTSTWAFSYFYLFLDCLDL